MVPIFLINLDRRTDRLAFMEQQLSKQRLSFTRISAVNGYALSEQQKSQFDLEKFFLLYRRKMVPGEMGCALSHCLIWQNIVANNIPFALILEDDVVLDEDFSAFAKQPENYQRFDFINLAIPSAYDGSVLQQCLRQNQLHRPLFGRGVWWQLENLWPDKRRIFQLHQLGSGKVACEADPIPAMTSAYIVSLQAARAFLATSNKIYFPIDNIWRFSGGKLRQAFLTQPLAKQSLDSDISGREAVELSFGQWVKKNLIRPRRLRRHWDLIRLYGLKNF